MHTLIRVLLAACWFIVGGTVLLVAEPSPSSTPIPLPGNTHQPAAMGLAGCAARGCHGGPLTNDDGSWKQPGSRNACSHWLEHDPHTRAFRSLLGDTAKRIMANLAAPNAKPADASTDVRCLACHVTPSLAIVKPSPTVVQLRIEGVSCDACHTSPGRRTEDWYEPHKHGWKSGDLARCFSNHGMQWLGTAGNRAVVCVSCHVGAPADLETGIPLREVNHDLIAAGHPRLNFDYATFLAALPPHWTERPRESSGAGSDSARPLPRGFDVQSWFAGTVESTRAGLNLLADQAQRGTSWPELAVFNCAACHHDLTGAGEPNWRQRRPVPPPLGSLVANTIPDPLREWQRGDTAFAKQEQELTRLTVNLGRDRARIAELARTLARDLDRAKPPANGAELLRGLRFPERDLTAMPWDTAAQNYYALLAVNRERRRTAANLPPDAALLRLAEQLRLRLPRTANTPTNYDPATIAPLLRTVADSLGK